MKKIVAIVIFFYFLATAEAQYYLRGEVKDEHGNLLKNVRILLHSSGYLYYSGNAGAFGIQVPASFDSITLTIKDFQPLTVRVDTRIYQSLNMKLVHPPAPEKQKTLLSATKNRRPEDWKGWTVGTETYNTLLENEFIAAEKFPETGFAVNTDKASYSNIRRFLNMGITVPPDAVRTEELLNYFNFDYQAPPADSTFLVKSFLSDCPWREDHQLLFIHTCARKIDFDKVPPANLVFLIDISGSMDMPNRLPLLKSAFQLLVSNLREKDTVSIVVYGSSVGVWLPPTPGNDKKAITKAIEELYPGGPTPGEAGIRAAYRLANYQFIHGGNNRVIMATDGDFNVGENTEEELEKLIVTNKHWGIYLTCLGVGMGNYKDSKLQVLAERGNGNFAYLDDAKEAEKVLMHEFTQTMYAVADDAYVNIRFAPSMVKEYRLIGFDNKWKNVADSVNVIQGGEVGSGHSSLAIFEIVPPGAFTRTGDSAFAQISLNYKNPGDTTGRCAAYTCSTDLTPFNDLPASMRFASSVALFSGLLRKSVYVKPATWNDALELARQALDTGDPLQQEYITLIEKAKKIYGREKKVKK